MTVEAINLQPDTDTHRTCGACLHNKHVDEFYSDGKDLNGKKRYRRDCKQCYRTTRMKADAAKRKKAATAQPKTKPRGRTKRR